MRKDINLIFQLLWFAIVVLQTVTARGANFAVTTDPTQTCSAIELEGVIQAGDYDRFVETVKSAKKLGPLRRLYLNSSGGNLATALAITEFIRNTAPQVETIVRPRQMCNSACVIVLSVGFRHLVAPDAQLVIHQALNEKTGKEDPEVTKRIGQYLALNGMPPDVMWSMGNLQAGEQVAILPSNAKRLGFGKFIFYGGSTSPATPDCSWEGWVLENRQRPR